MHGSTAAAAADVDPFQSSDATMKLLRSFFAI
jgi:hypothetical protein